MDSLDLDFGYVAPTIPLESALVWQTRALADLLRDMRSFKAVPEDQYKPPSPVVRTGRETEEEERDNAALEAELWEDDPPDCSPDGQFWDAFGDGTEALSAMIALTSHALCEATINTAMAVLALKHRLRLDDFESLTFFKKWVEGPRRAIPEYDLSGMLIKRLLLLRDHRNLYAHAKSSAWEVGKENFEVCDQEQECGTTDYNLSSHIFLVYDLLANLAKHDQSLETLLHRRAELEICLRPFMSRGKEKQPSSKGSRRRKRRPKTQSTPK